MMKRIPKWFTKSSATLLTGLAILAGITARLSAGTASSWGGYQPQLPSELSR